MNNSVRYLKEYMKIYSLRNYEAYFSIFKNAGIELLVKFSVLNTSY